jgi:glutamate-1-semialdehyde 2,1-aminomutase
MKTMISRPKSEAAFLRATECIPGGVNSPARAFGAVGGHPIFISKGEGEYLFDLDGNRYLDFIGSWGPMILGHCHPRVMEAVMAAVQRGSSYGAPCEAESELAELIAECVPSIEMVRMVSSGTEAAMSAIRLARGVTGRNKVIKFAGCYHGHVDSLLVSAGSSALTLGVPTSPGVPVGATQDTIILPYNNPQALEEAFQAQPDAIAGVMLEPVVGNMGLVVPTPEFLDALRKLTLKYGSLLIFDEVMTGFRLSLGGAQQILGITPDVTVLGKIVGGGYPVGAYGASKEIMRHVMPAGPIFQAGTLSGNPVAMAAGLATLHELKNHPPYEHLEQVTDHLCKGLKRVASQIGIPHQINRVGSMWTFFFTGTPVTDLETAKTSNTAAFSQFFWGMMDRGFYLPCSQFEAAFNCAMMDDEQADAFVAAAKEVLTLIHQGS